MRKRSGKQPTPKRRSAQRDENQMAFDALQQVIRETEGTGKNPIAVLLGRRGGLKGGRARISNMTHDEIVESARRAAKARWAKHRDK